MKCYYTKFINIRENKDSCGILNENLWFSNTTVYGTDVVSVLLPTHALVVESLVDVRCIMYHV